MALRAPLIASGPLADLGYAEETSYGEVPASPALKTCPRRSTTLGLTKDSYASEIVRRDREVDDMRHGVRRAAGDVVTEVTVGVHADFWQAALGGYWRAPAVVNVATGGTPVTVTAIDEGVRIAGYDFTASNFLIGDNVTFAGTGTTLDGAVFTLLSGGASARLLAWDEFDKSVLPITTTTGTMRMKGGRCERGNIYRSFIFERAFTDIGRFKLIKGQRANTVAVDLPATGLATVTFGFVGQDATGMLPSSIDGIGEVSLGAATLTSLTFNGATRVVTAGAGDFVAAGFAPGDKVAFDGTGILAAQNRNVRTIVAVTATTLTLAEAIENGGPYTAPFTVTRVALPNYTPAPEGASMAAVSGKVVHDGMPVATITGFSFGIDNGFGGSEVVGRNVLPTTLFGNQAPITGSLTILLDREGPGAAIFNAFEQEIEVSLMMRLDSADGLHALTFSFPRVKLSTGGVGDVVPTGIPVTCDWQALKPKSTQAMHGKGGMTVGDTTIAAPVAIV